MRILVLDVGGTHVKVLATGHRQRVKFPSGPKMTPAKMVAMVRTATADWKYDVVSIGYIERIGALLNYDPQNMIARAPRVACGSV